MSMGSRTHIAVLLISVCLVIDFALASSSKLRKAGDQVWTTSAVFLLQKAEFSRRNIKSIFLPLHADVFELASAQNLFTIQGQNS
jgi:hypothetical protein